MAKKILKPRPRFTDDGEEIPVPVRLPQHWRPGQSGNPGGHPGALTATVRERMDYIGDDGKTNAERITDAMIAKARKGDVEAAKWLADRGYGKPVQPSVIEHRSRVVKVVEAPPEETREEWLARNAKLHILAEEAEREDEKPAAPVFAPAPVDPDEVN